MAVRIGIGARLRIRILERDGFRCVYCGQTADDAPLHVDHVIPLYEGGRTVASNLVTACQSCNLGKGRHCLVLPEHVLARLAVHPTPEHRRGVAGKIDDLNDTRVACVDSERKIDEFLAAFMDGALAKVVRTYKVHLSKCDVCQSSNSIGCQIDLDRRAAIALLDIGFLAAEECTALRLDTERRIAELRERYAA